MTSLLQKINDLNVRVDNIDTTGNTSSSETAETLGEQVFYAVSSVDVLIGNVITYLSTFNSTPKTNTDLYSFTNNNTINIIKSGFYKINFNCNFHNIGFNERTTIRTSVMLNGISNITSGGQASAYLRNNTNGPRGTTTGALFYDLTAGDYIQLQNNINKGADTGFDTNFNSDYEFTEGSSIMITRMDINAVTADGTFLQGKLIAGDNITITGDVISATGGGGGTTDTTALQAQIDTNTTDISGIQINKQNTLIAGDNITITGDTISASGGGGGSSVHFLCSLNINFTSLLVGNYARFPNIVFQNPTTTTMIDINNGHGYTIQEDGLYHIGYSITALDKGGTVEIGILYIRNSVEIIISRSGIAVALTEDRSTIWHLQVGDIVCIKYISGNAGYLTLYGSTSNDNIKTNMYGYKIG